MSISVQAPRVTPVTAPRQAGEPGGVDDAFSALLAAQTDEPAADPTAARSATARTGVRPPAGARTGGSDAPDTDEPVTGGSPAADGATEPADDEPATAAVPAADPGAAAFLAVATPAVGAAGAAAPGTPGPGADPGTAGPVGPVDAPAFAIPAGAAPGGPGAVSSLPGVPVPATAPEPAPDALAADQAPTGPGAAGAPVPAPEPSPGTAGATAERRGAGVRTDSSADGQGAPGEVARPTAASSEAAPAVREARPADAVPTAPAPLDRLTPAGTAALTPGTPSGAAATSSATALPTPTAAATPVPFAQQLGARLTALSGLAAGTHVLTVPIDPENLGPVRVVARISAGSVRVELIGATDASREALRGALDELRRDLAAALPTSVDVSSGGSSFTGGERPSAEPGDAGRPWSTRVRVGPGPSPSPTAPASVHSGRLDLLV